MIVIPTQDDGALITSPEPNYHFRNHFKNLDKKPEV